jgi:DNA replication protein DnaC
MVNRSMREVNPDLRACFGLLCRGKGKWPLFLHGEPGRGKTCAALALADYLNAAYYRTAEQLVDELLGGGWADRWLRDPSLAILDELGTRERNSDVHYQVVQRFSDLRDCRPAIYISNLTPEEIPKAYDDRIASRILCGTWFHLAGPDRRMV